MTDKTEKDNTPDTNSYDDQAIRKVRDLLQSSPNAIGPYRILERLGAGGMGEVYRCEQRQPIRREVALKLIKLGMDTKQVIARFSAERQALAMMDHPNIAKVFDAGTDDTGRPYFVMEYVKGKPITEYADDKQLSLDDRLQLFQQVCHAIQHAHHKGVIHRDLKPSNVLVSTQDGRAHAKVIDFGIAKAMHQKLTDMTLFTEHALLVGTPAYMSPEQAEGSIDIDTRSDVYSLGVLLYELLTGHTPFDPIRLKKAALMEVARIIREEEPPKPSTKISALTPLARESSSGRGAGGEGSSRSSLTSLAKARALAPESYAKQLRGELDWIVMKTLEKDRKRRYSSPEDLAQDIERHLEGVPIEAAPPDIKYRTQKFVKKHKAALVGASVIIGLLVLALVGTSIGLLQARRATVRAQDATVREQAARAKETKAREDAEFQAYIANIVASQIAMDGEAWPEARQRLEQCPENLRGWEWNFLKNQASTPEFAILEPTSKISISADDRYLLCMNGLKSTMYDLKDRKILWVNQSKAIEFDRGTHSQEYDDDRMIGIALPGGFAAITSGNSLMAFLNNGSKLASVEFVNPVTELWTSPSGSFIGGAGAGGYLRSVGRITNPKGRVEIGGKTVPVWAQNESKFAFYRGHSMIEIWNSKTLKLDTQITYETKDNYFPICLSKDGSTLFVCLENEIRSYATGTGTIAETYPITKREIGMEKCTKIDVSDDGKSLLCHFESSRYSSMYALDVFDLPSRSIVATKFSENKLKARFSKNGNEILIVPTGEIWRWANDPKGALADSPSGTEPVQLFSRDGSFSISINSFGLRVWFSNCRNTRSTFLEPTSNEIEAKISCGRFGNRHLYFHEWNSTLEDALLVSQQEDYAARTSNLPFSNPRATWMATQGENDSIEIVDRDKHQPIATLGIASVKFRSASRKVRVATISPDLKRFVTAHDDYSVRLWDTDRWTETAIVRGKKPIDHLAFTEDGSRLVIGYSDGRLASWDARDESERDQQIESIKDAELQNRVERFFNRATSISELALDQHDSNDEKPHDLVRFAKILRSHIELFRDEAISLISKLREKYLLKENILSSLDDEISSSLMRDFIRSELDRWNPDKYATDAQFDTIVRDSATGPEKLEIAIRYYEGKAQSEPEPFIYWRNLGIAQYRMRRFEGARDALATAERLGVSQGESINDMAILYAYIAMNSYQLKDSDSAVSYLEKARLKLGLLYYDSLRTEAYQMINPQFLEPSIATQRIQSNEISKSVNVGDVTALRSSLGKPIQITGRVSEIERAVDGSGFWIYFDSGFVVVSCQGDVVESVSDTCLRELMNSSLIVTGVLTKTPSNYFLRVQVEINSWDQISIVSSEEKVKEQQGEIAEAESSPQT